METEEDEKYEHEAINALDHFLSGFEIPKDAIHLGLTIKEITDAYITARDILRSNPEDNRFRQVADTVFGTSIRVVRGLLLKNENAKNILIDKKIYTLIPSQQLEIMRKEYKIMKEFEEKC